MQRDLLFGSWKKSTKGGDLYITAEALHSSFNSSRASTKRLWKDQSESSWLLITSGWVLHLMRPIFAAAQAHSWTALSDWSEGRGPITTPESERHILIWGSIFVGVCRSSRRRMAKNGKKAFELAWLGPLCPWRSSQTFGGTGSSPSNRL